MVLIELFLCLVILSVLTGVGYWTYSKWSSFTKVLSQAFDPKIPDKTPCASGERDDGVSCWLDTYGNGVGTLPKKYPCAEGQRDDGVSCWTQNYGRGAGSTSQQKCENDGQPCEKSGLLWYPKCKEGYKAVGCCLCQPVDGPPHIVKNLSQRQYCDEGQTNVASLCYKNCKEGYEYVGGNLCQPKGGPRITKTAFQRYKCPPGKHPEYTKLTGALCYKP